jgi:predicted molibdopterin-dependent oxidoreductase YjgC
MPLAYPFEVLWSLVLKKIEKNAMFKRINNAIPRSKTVTLTIDEKEIAAFQGDTVAAAMLAAGFTFTRITPVKEERRAPYCMMGICFDCLVEINGIPNQRACQILVQEGMRVNIQKKEGSLKL